MKKLWLNWVVLIFLSVIVFLFWGINFNKRHYSQILEIDKKLPLKTSLRSLPISENIIFKIYVKMRKGGRDIKAGYYELNGDYSIKDLVDLLEEGRYKMVKFTIPEGYSYGEILDSLEKNKLVDRKAFEEILSEKDFYYPTPGGNFEGYFYPETYFIPEGSSENEIADIFLGEFLKKFPEEKYPDREEFYKMLILASIVEREAQLKDEKKLISSVFHNRLKIGMNLASDATVNYLYGYSKRRMYYKDLEIDSPYNTYMYRGLPPAPICNPDYLSIEAAFNPLETEYLFFVAKGDGSHYFSKTYDEHIKFQKDNEKKR
ncbi:endolytic transglycosylase MltG [uncultured Ilyobacter sp.]|uniref:endolytic transglycosylase MltG n=1 Tax=uncultured Ilyobacter sp. TaxID=544433 RepID=UPI0029BFCE16|nr:endolytic transglycosylase MltG [uncultured Ilyobacter sp.]